MWQKRVLFVLQKNHVFHMRSVWEHIYRLHCNHLVVAVEQLQVACLGSWVAADINDFPW